MRWPQLGRHRRRGDGSGAQDAPASSSAAAAPATSRPWSRLPPIAPTWAARTPLTAPPMTALQPLLAPATRRQHSAAPAEGVPEPGRIVGLVAVVRPQSVDPEPAADLPAYFHSQPPLRHATARPIVEHTPLTEATDAFVGEPTAAPSATAPVPAPPSAFPPPSAPRPDPSVEAITDAGARFREALANLHNSGLPRYISPSESSWERPERPAPSPAPPSPPPAPASDAPRLTHRRNTLAQSRRLGLGAPLKRAGADDGDDGSDAEPASVEVEVLPPVVRPPVPTPPAVRPPVLSLPPAAPPPAPAEEPPPAQPVPGDIDDGGSGATGQRAPLEPIVVAAHPITDGTARPTAAATPLVFRAARARRTEQRAATTRAVERAVVTRPPAELAQALRSSHGIDVTDVPVQRDPAAGSEARERRARAFTRGGRVFLPEDAGHLGSAKARGLLAHELVHAAQQRRLGHALPAEDTAEGRALEAEAQAAERLYSSAPAHFEEPQLIHAPQPVSAAWVDSRITQHAGDPIDYLDETRILDSQQTADFQVAADTAVQQALQNFEQRGGQRQNVGADASELQVVERDFLDIINRELESKGDPPQAQLSDRDRERVRQMLVNQGQGGGSNYVAPQADSEFGRWQQQHLGSAMALGADAGGIGRWAELFRHHGAHDQQHGGQAGGQGGTGAGTPGAHHDPTRGQMFLHGLFGWNVGGDGSGQGGQQGAQQGAQQGLHRGAGPGNVAGQTGASTGATVASADEHGVHGFLHRMFGTEHVSADASGIARWRELSIHGHHGTQADAHAAGAHPDAAAAGGAHAGRRDPNVGHVRTTTAASSDFDASKDVTVDDVDLDALALKLYDRLRSRLRRELLVDRERAGLLTDFR